MYHDCTSKIRSETVSYESIYVERSLLCFFKTYSKCYLAEEKS